MEKSRTCCIDLLWDEEPPQGLFLTYYGVKISTILKCMALEMIVVPIQHWSHNTEGSQFTASMNREMLHDQYPLYKYILVCEFCYSECPTILFLGKLNQSGASVTLPTIVTWMIQNICKPTVEGPAGILCCGCQSDMKSWGFVWTCNCHRSKRMITKCLLFHIFTLLNIDCYINRHCIS